MPRHVGGLGGAQSFHVAHHDDDAERVGQRRYLALHDVAQLGMRGLLLRIGRVGFDERDVHVFSSLIEGTDSFAAAAERLVDGDAREPGRELRVARELVQVLVGVEIGLLHHILGIVVRPSTARTAR